MKPRLLKGGDNMLKYKKFLIYWFINAALLYIVRKLFPIHYTFGNSILDPYQAVFITSFAWSFVQWNVKPFFRSLDVEFRCNSAMAVKCLFVNFSIVWMIARYSILSGIGISSSLYVFLLALLANFAQHYAWLRFKSKK